MLGKFKAEALPVVIDILFTYFFFGKNNWTGINIYFLFSLEHCVAAWEHPLLSLSLLLVRTIWQRRYVNEQFRFKLLTLDPPTVLEKKFSRLPFCVLSFVIWMKEINTDEMLINTNRNGGSRRCLWSVQLHKTRCQSQPGAKGSSKYLRSFFLQISKGHDKSPSQEQKEEVRFSSWLEIAKIIKSNNTEFAFKRNRLLIQMDFVLNLKSKLALVDLSQNQDILTADFKPGTWTYWQRPTGYHDCPSMWVDIQYECKVPSGYMDTWIHVGITIC